MVSQTAVSADEISDLRWSYVSEPVGYATYAGSLIKSVVSTGLSKRAATFALEATGQLGKNGATLG